MPLVLVFAYAQDSDEHADTDIDVVSAVELSAAAIKLSANCDTICADAQADSLISALQHENLSDAKAQQTLQQLLEDSALTAEQQQLKLNTLIRRRTELSSARQLLQSTETPAAIPETDWWQRLQQSDHSVVKWAQGILADLGISFGWAVAYLTVFISWNNGQTPGKRLLGIKVVQLNNKPLTLWGAFGRQGGYSAGIATGLLGFLQIFWDPNRQAMQDKLADTLVLRLNT